MISTNIVIVGTGQAGLQVAASLRDEGFQGYIRLIGREKDLPYQRPPLSKAFLKTGDRDRLWLRAEDFYKTADIEVILGETVSEIDRALRSVRTESARTLDYDHLILATGARNISLPISGANLGGIYDLRTLQDAAQLREVLPETEHLLVVGGGFIGLEFAAVARELGHEVTVIEAAPRLMARAVSEAISAHFLARHEARGIRIFTGHAAKKFNDDSMGNVAGITLNDGSVIHAGFVLSAVGVRPNTTLASAAGLTLDNGIKVDGQLLTEDPHISAIGDCAAFPDPISGDLIRLESVQAAVDQARLVARRIVKTSASDDYDAVPWFWSNQADDKLQIAGFADRTDFEDVQHVGKDGVVVSRFLDDRLRIVETVNLPKMHMAARQLLKCGIPVTRAAFEAANRDLLVLWQQQKKR